jgi:tetratricopeptide (TPR) repeat protein
MGDIKPTKPKTISTTLLSKPSSPDGKKGPSSSKKSDHQASIDSYLKYYTFQKYQKQSYRSVGSTLWGDVFRPTNPIHTSRHRGGSVSPKESWKAYEKLTQILRVVKEVNSKACLRPEDKLELVYATMDQMGLRFGDMDNTLLTQNLNSNQLDCDTSSFVVMAVAHEMGWPVHLVMVPNHVFVRWDDGKGTRFNMDFGEIRSDEYYIKEFKIPPENLQKGIHLKNLTPSQSLALFLHNRGADKADHGDLSGAMADFTESLFLNPKYADSYLDRGQIRMELGEYSLARKDLSRAERIDPRYSGAEKNVEYTRRFRKALHR